MKLVDSFAEILERDFIQSDLEVKYLQLIRMYGESLKDVQEVFLRDRHRSSVGKFFERQVGAQFCAIIAQLLRNL